MRQSEARLLSMITTVAPTRAQVEELKKNPAFLNVLQTLARGLDSAYSDITKPDTDLGRTQFIRGHINATEGLFRCFAALEAGAPEAYEGEMLERVQNAEEQFREAINNLTKGDTNNV